MRACDQQGTEDIAFEEGDFALDIVAVGVRVGAPDAVGEDDQAATLALAHLGAKFLRLLVGHPDRAGETAGHRFSPEHQDIDAAIRLAVVAEWPGDAAGGMFGVPGLEPRADALFQLFDNAAGNPRVEVAFFCSHDFVPFRLGPPYAASTQAKGGAGPRQRRDGMRRGIPGLHNPGLDPGAEGWGNRRPGEALVPKRRGAPQDCAGRGHLGRLRKGQNRQKKALLPDFYAVMVECGEVGSRPMPRTTGASAADKRSRRQHGRNGGQATEKLRKENGAMSLPFEPDGSILTIAGAALTAVAWAGHEWLFDRRFRHETGSAYGTSHWANSRDLKRAALFGSDGVVLGRYHGHLLRHRTDKHLLTLAPNRAGKGVSAIIPNLLTWPGSVLVIDPKGENAMVTARRRREMGQSVHVLDPWGITGLDGGRFNPLLALAPDSVDLVEDAALLADGLVLPGTKADDEFWNGEARSLIAGLLMHIVTTELPEDRHLGTLRVMLTLGEKEIADLLEDMIDNHAASGLVARTARRLMQKTDRERSGVISTAQAQTHFLDSPRMTEVLKASSFDLGDLKSGATTIFLVLPADRLATHGRWLRLVVGLCLSALTRDRRAPPYSVLFMLDEFAALGRLQAVETAMGLLAGYGVLLWPILQDLSADSRPLPAPLAVLPGERGHRPGLRRQRYGHGGISLEDARPAHGDDPPSRPERPGGNVARVGELCACGETTPHAP